MTKAEYKLFEDYMLSCMLSSTHDSQHIYRVLYAALDIAATEPGVDYDALICACLLHDIGRVEQDEDPSLSHAAVGAEKAYRFLTAHGYSEDFAARVRNAIRTHRFRADAPPVSLEAKILFDADKLDITGAMGVARTLTYAGQMGIPLYNTLPDGTPSDGVGDATESFFSEYKYKLESIYEKFFTRRGRELAAGRREASRLYYEALLRETRESLEGGRARVEGLVK